MLMFGANRAGKSVLTARLMAAGHIGCGDDMIGMTEEGEIVSFGIPPRLRLPLPRSRPCPDIQGDERRPLPVSAIRYASSGPFREQKRGKLCPCPRTDVRRSPKVRSPVAG